MPIGLFDLSIITDRLIHTLEACRDASPLWNPNDDPVNPGPTFPITVSGLPPDQVKDAGGCQLSLYLFHVARDAFQTNAFWSPQGQSVPGVPPVRYQPLALDLYYLLSAFAEKSYVQEQQVMSIALRCFHEHPIVRTTVPFPVGGVDEEFSLTMEVESVDALGRLWQAAATSLRLAAIYKVSVIFLEPERLPLPAPGVIAFTLAADPTTLPYAAGGQVTGTFRRVEYIGPAAAPVPDRRQFDLAPAIAGAANPRHRVVLLGANLNGPTSDHVYLVDSHGAEEDITDWKAAAGAAAQTDARVTLLLPSGTGGAPAGTPPPGVYQLRVGDAGAASRSNAVPFSIAAWVDPAGGPILAPDAAGAFALNGTGFGVLGTTEVVLETVRLAPTGGAPAAGHFTIGGAGTTLTFQPPADLPAGRYAVRVRVNGVESDPAKWIVVP